MFKCANAPLDRLHRGVGLQNKRHKTTYGEKSNTLDRELWELYNSNTPGKQKMLKEAFNRAQMKFCTSSGCKMRGLLQPFDSFCKNKHGVCGLLPHCRECHNPKQHKRGVEEPKYTHERRQRAIENLSERHRHYQKAISRIRDFAQLLKVASCPMELMQWQDGTKSDVGVRPLGSCVDRWLLLQMKSTERSEPPFTWIGCSGYDGMSIVGLTSDPAVIYFFPHDASRHTTNIRVSTSSQCSFDNEPVSVDALSELLHNRWSSDTTYSERDARMQCSVKSQREYATIMLDEYFHPTCKHEWPLWCTEVDRLCNGLRVQHKTAFWDATNGWFKSNLYKRVGGEHVPYRVGDVDVFKISTVHEQLRLFIQWTIPAGDMDHVFHKLSHESGVESGETTMQLHLIGPNDENVELHSMIFGNRIPDSRADRRSSKYVEIHIIPTSYCIPDCMRGRDPVG